MHHVATPAGDDSFHPPVHDDLSWTETAWFGLDLPERSLSMAIYPLFRPVMGICSLAIHLWDDTGVAPWEIPYSRFLWHVPMPAGDLTDIDIAGLRIRMLDPSRRYVISYSDADRIGFELEFEGIRPPHHSSTQLSTSMSTGTGHFDQAMVVNGEMVLNGEQIRVECYGQRDRSWYVRSDTVRRPSGTASFGTGDRDNHFMVVMPKAVLGKIDDGRRPGGYLVTGGELSEIVDADRRVVSRVDGRPRQIELDLRDATGRQLNLVGRPKNTLAFNTSPPVLSFFSQMEWTAPGGRYVGEDQDVLGMDEAWRVIRDSRQDMGSSPSAPR